MSVKVDLAHCLTDFFSAEDSRTRNISAGQCFACYQDIRGHTLILTCEHGTCLSNTGNYLIKDQERAVLVTQLSDTFPESLWRNNDTACCEDRL